MAAWMAFARTAMAATTKTSHQMVSSANQSSKLVQRRELCNLASGKDPHGPPKEKSYAGYKLCGLVIYIVFWGYAMFGEVPKKKKKLKIVTINDGVRDRPAVVEYRSYYPLGF